MAFGAEELRVLRRALAIALHPGPVSAEDVQDCHRLAESLDEAMREAARLRAFLVADLAPVPRRPPRHRRRLSHPPGGGAGRRATGPTRTISPRCAPCAATRPPPPSWTAARRLAEQDVRARLARPCGRRAAPAAPTVPASRTRLQALPGGLSGRAGPRAGRRRGAATGMPEPRVGDEAGPRRGSPPRSRPRPRPAEARPRQARRPEPARRPIPTPGEVFPRRKPTPPPPTAPAGRRLTRTAPARPPPRRIRSRLATLERMDYVSALVPPVVMAVFFIGLIRVIVKTQGGANKAKEDAAVDAALARAEGARQASVGPDA